MAAVSAQCARLAGSRAFQLAILGVIIANAVVIGIETYPRVRDDWSGWLRVVDVTFLVVFTVEIVIRLLAFGRRPWRFFSSGWNVFDFLIVVLALLPVVGANVTLVRLVRVLRVVRLVEAIDDLRMIVVGLARSLAALAGVAVFVVLVMYVYAVTGTALYGEALPAEWGTVGAAMLTCFRILTLDNWNDLYFAAAEVSAWTPLYFVSFIVVATLVVLNIVIAVVVSSVEQARQSELERESSLVAERAGQTTPELAERIVALRLALDELEAQLGARD